MKPEKKRKRGRPRSEIRRVGRSGCRVLPGTAELLNDWEDRLRPTCPEINPGRLLDHLANVAGPAMEKYVSRRTAALLGTKG